MSQHLKTQLEGLLNDEKSIKDTMQKYAQEIDRIVKELEQHKGAQAYNQMLIERVAAQIKAAEASQSSA